MTRYTFSNNNNNIELWYIIHMSVLLHLARVCKVRREAKLSDCSFRFEFFPFVLPLFVSFHWTFSNFSLECI